MTDTTTLAGRLDKLIRTNHHATRQPPTSRESRAPAPPPSAPDALRALILEADPLHGQILAGLIENLGYAVDAARTSEEALEAFESCPYALILLDTDSREMRGLETAAALRRLESGSQLATDTTGPRPPRTPILALTAHAGQEDRERREAAGIDNYLAKPIRRESVVSALARYAPLAPEAPGTAPRYLALDRHRLEELEDAAGSRPEILSRWVRMFLESAPQLVDRMRTAHRAANAAAFCSAADELRSRSGQVGALRVQEICGIAAALGGSGSLDGGEALLPELAVALDRAAAELNQLDGAVRRGVRLSAVSAKTFRRRNATPPESNQVLLAEADPLTARFLTNSLAGGGFAVTQVPAGRAALDAVREKEFAAAILDLDLPEVDGYGVLSEIRVRPDGSMPVMVVSARHQEQDILRAFELGADDYVTIPFSPLEVVARVRRLVKQGAHVS